jgi:hypothetical protein
MECPNCNNELILGGNHDIEDNEESNIVSNYHCNNEDCNINVINIYATM